MLFQPTGYTTWMVGPSDQATSCESNGYLTTTGYRSLWRDTGYCPDSPNGASCAGKWPENAGDCGPDWCLNPSIAVVPNHGKGCQCDCDGCFNSGSIFTSLSCNGLQKNRYMKSDDHGYMNEHAFCDNPDDKCSQRGDECHCEHC